MFKKFLNFGFLLDFLVPNKSVAQEKQKHAHCKMINLSTDFFN